MAYMVKIGGRMKNQPIIAMVKGVNVTHRPYLSQKEPAVAW